MTEHDAIDRRLAAWMRETATAPHPADQRHQAITAATRARPLQRWRATFGADWVGTSSFGPGGLTWAFGRASLAVLLVLGLLVAAAIAGALLAGAHLTRPSPATQGTDWIAYTEAEQNSTGTYVSLVTPGGASHRIAGADGDGVVRACASFSSDGMMLAYGQAEGDPDHGYRNAALVVGNVSADGRLSAPATFSLATGGDAAAPYAPPCAAWAPGRPLLAYVLATTDPITMVPTGDVVTIATLSGGKIELQMGTPVFDLAWAPGGDTLAVSTADGITLRAASGERPGAQPLAGTRGATSLSWSPNGRYIAFSRPAGGDADLTDLLVLDLQAQTAPVALARYAANHGMGPLWSPAGDALLYQQLCTAQPETGGPCREQHEVVILSLRVGVSGWRPGTVSEQVLPATRWGDYWWFPYRVVWSPDGSSVLMLSWPDGGEGTAEGLIIRQVAGGSPQAVVEFTGPITGELERGISPTVWARVP